MIVSYVTLCNIIDKITPIGKSKVKIPREYVKYIDVSHIILTNRIESGEKRRGTVCLAGTSGINRSLISIEKMAYRISGEGEQTAGLMQQHGSLAGN
ncbi:hypothetical protein D3C76_1690150 [compost metagenome]